MADGIRVLLIGGTSHVGKSTLARQLAETLGWQTLCTDQFARHPGRPWRGDGSELPEDVVDYYAGMTADEQVQSVLQHYDQNVWPIADAFIRSRLNNPYDLNLILEGSALLPDRVLAAGYVRVKSAWLTEPDSTISRRIEAASDRNQRTAEEIRLIDAFLGRSLALGAGFRSAAARNDQMLVDGVHALEILLNLCQ